MKNRVVIFNLLPKVPLLPSDKTKLQRVFRKLFNLLKIEQRFLEVYLVSEQKMRFLNKKFRKKDKAVLALSFEHPKDFPVPYLNFGRGGVKFKPLGEIYLSVKAFKKNLDFILIHSLLHLLGFKHGSKMEKKEKEILCLI